MRAGVGARSPPPDCFKIQPSPIKKGSTHMGKQHHDIGHQKRVRQMREKARQRDMQDEQRGRR